MPSSQWITALVDCVAATGWLRWMLPAKPDITGWEASYRSAQGIAGSIDRRARSSPPNRR